MANFNLKYLDNYPVVSFEENIEYPEAVFEGYFHDIIKTERLFGHVLDSVKDNRTIQDIVYEKYTCDLLIGRNIDVYKLVSANHVMVTPEYGTEFRAIKFEVEIEDTNNRDKLAKITFYKEVEINYPLSCDYAEDVDASVAVNEIRYTVNNPPYVANYTGIHYDSTPSQRYYFTVAVNDLTDNILVGDYYYIHFEGTLLDNSEMPVAEVILKDSTDITFEVPYYVGGPTGVDDKVIEIENNIVIDHEPDNEVDANVIDKTIDVYIYTFIEPIFSHESSPETGSEAPDYILENQKSNERDVMSLKIWLKEADKWKAEYLNYALIEDVRALLPNQDTTNIVPAQMKDIIAIKENDNFIDLFEYDITMLFNIKVVNINR
jgi:hypothetical protein